MTHDGTNPVLYGTMPSGVYQTTPKGAISYLFILIDFCKLFSKVIVCYGLENIHVTFHTAEFIDGEAQGDNENRRIIYEAQKGFTIGGNKVDSPTGENLAFKKRYAKIT